ncbi:class I SAM-dependent methyltransferase [Salinimicrobium flavum]|uniref:Class I SAM-dependent methyltransferase n=1 Tax=Salinimicrobium flavum TaxID=1737065 RepID=A0ABW5IX29_9FLAO
MPSTNYEEKPFLICKDHTVSGRFFELKKDEDLDLLVTHPRPEIEKLPEYYKSENYISHTDSKKTFFDKIYHLIRSYMLRKKLSWIKKAKKEKGNLLDIGAGTGDFLKEAKEQDWKISGVEPNTGAREIAYKKGVHLKADTSSFPSDHFDVITMWHVLEHVPDLDIQIAELDRLLKRDGLLVIAVPNYNSYDAILYKEFWAAYDVPRHLYHFSRHSIRKVFRKFSFKVCSEKGLPFDAFYVSLLSEKNRYGKSHPLKAFFNGLRSNLEARWTKEYSSIAYFIKKS